MGRRVQKVQPICFVARRSTWRYWGLHDCARGLVSSRCAGLCCVVPAFYRIQGFGFDKPAHAACKHLSSSNRCQIHRHRIEHGFAACASFDCYGAGQRVTSELCGDVSWRASAERAMCVFAAYESCLALYRLMAMLTLAEKSSARELRVRLRLKRMQLHRLCRSNDARRGRLDLAALRSETLLLVRQCIDAPLTAATPPALRGLVRPQRNQRIRRGGAARRQVAGQPCGGDHDRANQDVSKGIQRTDLVQ